jgi:hypothetical protein
MPQQFFMLEIKVRKCTAEAWINDIPCFRVTPSRSTILRAVHQYLLPGANRFTIVIQPGPTPGVGRIPGLGTFIPEDDTSASLRLMSMPEGSFDGDPGAVELFRLDWAPPPAQPVVAPVVLENEVAIPGAGHEWEWLNGDTFGGPAALTDVVAMLNVCREAMDRRDPEPFLERAQMRFRANQLAYGLETEPEMATFRQQFAAISAEPGFAMEPLNPMTMDLRICGGGKLVDCLDLGWEPVLRSVKQMNGVVRLRYPIKAASVKGVIQIVL